MLGRGASASAAAAARRCLTTVQSPGLGGRGSGRNFSSTACARADFTHVVIGGGVIGLATARALSSQPNTTTLLLERHPQIGTETSSRNSEVIHAGLYYGRDSLKTSLCIKGKQMLYDFCPRHGVGFRNTGKWIVAQNESQMTGLEAVHKYCSEEIGVPTRFLSQEEAQGEEPAVRARAGVLESPTTGIVDSHGLMVALQGLFEEEGGGVTALGSRVVGIEALDGGEKGWKITVQDAVTGETSEIESETLVNCAGLGAVDVHNMIIDSPSSSSLLSDAERQERRKTLYYAKGNYFSYASSTPKVSRLVYPAPTPGLGGLGTHLTLDMAGRIRFGPDVEWVDSPDNLQVNDARFPQAKQEIREFLPDVEEDALAPDYAGIRPKLAAQGGVGSGKGFIDFYIRKEEGFEGWVNLLGMESPGLTSSLAVGEYVREMLYGSVTRRGT